MADTPTPDELRAAVEKAEQERDAAIAKAEEAVAKSDELTSKVTTLEKSVEDLKKAGSEPDDDDEDINKADLPEPVRKRLEKAEQEAKETRERAEKAEKDADEANKLAKAERDERVTREFVAKAEEYAALPLDAVEFGPVLKRLSESLPEADYEAVATVLKAADEQIAKGELFKEYGSGATRGEGENVEQDLTRKAEEIRKSDSTVSKTDAMRRAMRENPELAAKYLAANR